MDNPLQRTLSQIHAEPSLTDSTAELLRQTIARRRIGPRRAQRALLSACLTLVFLFGGAFYYFYAAPASFVDLDVNPSIELTVNRMGTLIKAEPYNEDGAALLADMNLRGLHYDEAVDALVGALAGQGYLGQGELLSVTVQASDAQERAMLGTLDATIARALESHHTAADVDVFSVNSEVKAQSHAHHMTPTKYLAISELQTLDPSVTFEGCHGYTTGQINRMIEAHGGGHHSGRRGGRHH